MSSCLYSAVTNSGLTKISQLLVDRRKRCQQEVDDQCDKLATAVGRQFITLSVHLCLQHDGRNAVSRGSLCGSWNLLFLNIHDSAARTC